MEQGTLLGMVVRASGTFGWLLPPDATLPDIHHCQDFQRSPADFRVLACKTVVRVRTISPRLRPVYPGAHSGRKCRDGSGLSAV